jgi:hypothetical protein
MNVYMTPSDPNDFIFILGRHGASAAAALLQQVCGSDDSDATRTMSIT